MIWYDKYDMTLGYTFRVKYAEALSHLRLQTLKI